MGLRRLSPQAIAQIKAAQADAEATLGTEVNQFLVGIGHQIDNGQLKRAPTSEDLVPLFARYAMAVFDARARAILAVCESRKQIDHYIEQLNPIVESVVRRITAKGGVWRRVVILCCTYVDLGSWPGPEEDFDMGILMHPRPNQLRSALQVHAMRWKKAAWDKVAAMTGGNGGSPADSPPPSVPSVTSPQLGKATPTRPIKVKRRFPGRAEWLQTELDNRGWSKYDLDTGGGPHHKTVQRILDGHGVREHVLIRIASKLSTTRSAVDLADIPRD